MDHKKQLKNLGIAITLVIAPFLIFNYMPALNEKYFPTSPMFLLDLPYLLIAIIWGVSLYLFIKIRKNIENRKSFFNYLVLILAVLNGVLIAYFIYFIFILFFNK